MTSTIPAKRKFRDVNTVTLFVGASRNVFHVHEDTLCTASPVFKAAFESKFKEGTDRTMELPDEDPDLVEMFVGWLYRKTLHPNMFKLSAPDPVQALGLPQERLMLKARLFVLAEKYDVEALQACICENLFDIAANGLNEVPSFVVLEFIYANTHRKAIIRRVIADWFAWTHMNSWQGKGKTVDGSSTDWLYNIPEFSVDLALALYDHIHIARNVTPFRGNKSQYVQKLQEGTKGPECRESLGC